MITFEQAVLAQEKLLDLLNRPEWSRGIGRMVNMNDYSWYLKVNVSKLTQEIKNQIPDSIIGVPIIIEEVGDIFAS